MGSTPEHRRLAKLERLKRKAAAESPLLEFTFKPAELLHLGPIILTDLGVTRSHEAALKEAHLSIPPKVRCRFLIDTGADGCVVKHEIAERAGLKLISTDVPIHGVGVDTTGRIYMGSIWFIVESRTAAGITHRIAADTQILSGSLQNSQVIDGLIGRSILERFELKYNGRTGKVTMRYLRA